MTDTANTIRSWQFEGFNLKRFDINHHNPISLNQIFHDEIAFIAFEGAVWKSCQNGQSYLETPNCLVIRDAGQVFSLDTEYIRTQGAICREILVSPILLTQLQEATELRSINIDFRNPIINKPHLKTALLHTHSALETSDCSLEKSTYLYSFLFYFIEQNKLLKSKYSSLPSTDKVKLVIDYLRAYYYENISLNDLSELTQTNPFVLLRKFRKETGVTPHDYLNNIRIIHARNFIHSGMNLIDIALHCGFSDQSHLTRKFKSKVGVTPGRYAVL